MSKIRMAIVGGGNCASSLIQGLEFYRQRADRDLGGLMHRSIGGIGDRAAPMAASEAPAAGE